MTKIQKQIIKEMVIMLDKKDIKELTGWGQNTIDKLFAYDKDFPAIKIGKQYQVELSALKQYLQTRRTNKD